MNRNRILGFDVARVFSILYIIGYYHVLNYTGLSNDHPVIKTFAYSSLCIFTFISAYLLTSKYSFENKEKVLLFYKKRVLRFYPLFFVASISLYIVGTNSGISTLKGLLGISPFFKPHPSTMWYCAMLIPLYLLTPFWATGGWKKQVLKFLIVMGVIVAIDLIFHTVVPRTYSYFLVYFVGIMVSQYFGEKFLTFLRRYCILLLSLFIVLVVVTFITESEILKYINSGIGLFALLSLYLKIGDLAENHEKWENFFLWLSYASMCMYLFHRQVFGVMLKVYNPGSTIGIGLYLGIAGVVITIFVSYFIQFFYDKIITKIIK